MFLILFCFFFWIKLLLTWVANLGIFVEVSEILQILQILPYTMQICMLRLTSRLNWPSYHVRFFLNPLLLFVCLFFYFLVFVSFLKGVQKLHMLFKEITFWKVNFEKLMMVTSYYVYGTFSANSRKESYI